MIFKDLKQNGTLYLFDIKNITLDQAKVVEISLPHLDTHYTQPNEMVIDIIVEVDDRKKSFTMKENSEICYAGDLMVTPNKDAVLREVQSIKLKNENILDQVTYYKESIDKCSQLLKEHDPVYREKQESDARISNLETSLKEIQDTLKVLVTQSR